MLSVPSHCLDGKKIDPKHATPKSKSKANKTKKIFVGGVSQETSADEVKAYFNQFGEFSQKTGFFCLPPPSIPLFHFCISAFEVESLFN